MYDFFCYSLEILGHLELLSCRQGQGHPNNNNNNNHTIIIDLTGGPRDPCFPGGPLGPSSPYTMLYILAITSSRRYGLLC